MITLVIHTPYHRVKDGAKSFKAVLADGVGVGYIITPNELSILKSSSNVSVVVLDKDKKQRAEGTLINPLINLVPTKKAENGKQRYNVKNIKNLKRVQYKSESLNRNGIAVIQ